jgi:CheY-like chemotaxis protein
MSKKILLADDSITIQKVIELTFSDEDFDVITVGNGRLALEKLPEVRPDIVLCDIIMPERDGYEVCEQIKTSPATAHVPVLLLTGAFEPFDQERAARAGYDGSLAKPFEPETLIAKVKDLLARAPVRGAAPPPPVARAAAPPSVAAVPPPPVASSPAVLPFQRPAPPPAPPATPTFIPDEPFGRLEEPAFSEPAEPAAEGFAPMTEEESATLLAPPASPADAASTVMFKAGDLPWNAPTPAPAPPPAPEARPATTTIAAPEPVLVPETAEAAEEPTVFEEVLEEDLDFGEAPFEAPATEGSATVLFTPGVATQPPLAAEEAGATTGAFEPVGAGERLEPEPERVFEPEPVLEPEPPPVREPVPAFEPEPERVFEPEPLPVLEPEPPAFGREPVPVLEPEPAPVFRPEPVPIPEPEPAPRPAAFAPPAEPRPVAERPPVPPPAAESFADVAAAVAAPMAPAPPPSEAAAVSVPVEMVEKIAQRVVAQISEKAVREIAWEVIPDLAEALIKQEIERLKAELQKT